MNEMTKYEQLQRKTTGQLVRLVDRELEMGIRSIALEQNPLSAKRAYANAARLLPVAYPLCDDARGALEMKVDRLRELLRARLDASPPCENVAMANIAITNLARAVGAPCRAVCASC